MTDSTGADFFRLLVSQVGFRLPAILIYLIGMLLALIWWRRHPRVSVLALLGLGVLLLTSLGGALWSSYLPIYHRGNGRSPESIGALVSTIAMVQSVFSALGLGLLVACVFLDRPPPADWTEPAPGGE
jgi:hypothetical protein